RSRRATWSAEEGADVRRDVARALPAHAEAGARHELDLGLRAFRLQERAGPAIDEMFAVEHQHRTLESRHAGQRSELGEGGHRLPAVAADLELRGVDAVHP